METGYEAHKAGLKGAENIIYCGVFGAALSKGFDGACGKVLGSLVIKEPIKKTTSKVTPKKYKNKTLNKLMDNGRRFVSYMNKNSSSSKRYNAAWRNVRGVGYRVLINGSIGR